jgi:hypothetical protein
MTNTCQEIIEEQQVSSEDITAFKRCFARGQRAFEFVKERGGGGGLFYREKPQKMELRSDRGNLIQLQFAGTH